MATTKHLQNSARKQARRKAKLDSRASSNVRNVKVLFLRKGATIRTLQYEDVLNEDGNKIGEKLDLANYTQETFTNPLWEGKPSISGAKRKSRELQQANGGLGMGSLKIVKRFSDFHG